MGFAQTLSLRVTKAIVAEPSKTTHYVLTITNPVTQATISTRKRHRDFKRLQKAVLDALCIGHQCTSVCPWFYMDIQQKMPRPNPLALFSHGRVITQRIRAFQVLLDTIVAFLVNPASQLCSHTCDSVPKALYDFLFEDVDVQDSMYVIPHSTDSSSSSSSGTGSLTDSTCSLCTRYLSTFEHNSCISTLSCGHVFHDECIVQALNVSLECPCCHIPYSMEERLKEVLGLFLSRTPQEMTVEEGEAVEEAIIRLRMAMKALPTDTPLFWRLKYTEHLRELLKQHLTDTINSFVDEEMARDPEWMIVPLDKKSHYVDLVVDKMVMKYAAQFHQLQMHVHGEVATNVQTIMQELLQVSNVQQYFEKSTIDLFKSTDEVRSVHGVERCEVFSMDDGTEEDGSLWTGRDDDIRVTEEQIKAMLESMTHPSSKVRLEAFIRLKAINAENIIGSDSLTMVVQRLVPFMLDKDDGVSTDAIRYFYNLFIETHDITTQCQLFITFLQALMYSTPRTALFLRKPSISSAAPSQTTQRGLLRLLRCLQTLLLRLPNEWIYVPLGIQAKVYLAAAQFFGPWSPPNIVITEPNLTGNTAEWIPPYSIMACLDMTAEWFSLWYLKCPMKTQWIELLVATSTVQHCIRRVVYGHEAMELWRKFTRHTMSPAGVTYRRRSISRAALTSPSHVALDSPSPLPIWYTTLMQKSMIQAIHFILELLPRRQIQDMFPLQLDREQSISKEPSPKELQPDPSTNELMHNISSVNENDNDQETKPIAVVIDLDQLCLHVIMMSIAQVWRSDAGCCALGASPLDTMHSAMDLKLSTLVQSRRSIKFYKALTLILLKIRTLEHERPKDINSVAFPYSLAMVDNQDFIESALRYLKLTLVSKDHPRVISMVEHLSIALVKAMLDLSPDETTCCTILSLAQSSPALHLLIAKVCGTNLSWLTLFTKASWISTIRKLCTEWTSMERNQVLYHLAQSIQGLVLCYDLLLLSPLNLFALWQSADYDMNAILHLLNIPAYASAIIQCPELKRAYITKQKELVEHVSGLEALYSSCEDAPYELRDAVATISRIELVMWTPFIANQQETIASWLDDLNMQDDITLNLVLSIAQAWATSSHFGSFNLSELKYQPWLCDCPTSPCCIDPIAFKMHRIKQRLLFVGGITEVPRAATFELSPLYVEKPSGRPSTAMLGEFEAQFHHLLAEIEHSSSYLDFRRIGDHFWHLISEIDASPPSSAKLTIWMGDFFYNLVVCGKSKLDLPYPSAISIPEPFPIQQEPKWLKFINTWLKNYNYQLGLDTLPCSSLLPVVLQTLGEEVCDPLVWSILLMLSQRHDQKQVNECLLRLRHTSFALFLWPQLVRTHQLFHGCPAPIYVTASIAESILTQECPKIMITLRKLECPLLTLLLRWELHCFWSYLDWPNVMIYLNLVGIYGIDYIPLLLVVLVKHMRPVILQATKSIDVLDAQIPILKWSTYQTWLSHLHNQYHDMIKERMRSL